MSIGLDISRGRCAVCRFSSFSKFLNSTFMLTDQKMDDFLNRYRAVYKGAN